MMRIALFRFAPSALLLLVTGVATVAFGQAAARPDRGVSSGGSYAVSDIENINLSNGNLNLSIPLASLPPIAGGKLGFSVRAEYNSKNWDAMRQELQADPLDPQTRYLITNLQTGLGGWRIGERYSITFQLAQEDHDSLQPLGNDPEYDALTQNDWAKVILTMPDGSTHELRPLDKSAYADNYNAHNYLRGYYKDTPYTANASLRYYSFDGSHIWAKIDKGDYPFAIPSWTIYLPDGTRVEEAGGVQRIIDTNGNKVKIFTTESNGITTTHYQDELTEREIKRIFDPSANNGDGQYQVQYQAVGGQSWFTIYINFDMSSVQNKVYQFGDPNCSDGAVAVSNQAFQVVRSIVFPQTEPNTDPRQFSFAYNTDSTDSVTQEWYPSPCNGPQTITSTSHGLGSLNQVTMPSGAVVKYAYEFDGEVLFSDPNDLPRESLVSKELEHDGITEGEVWTYFTSQGGGGFSAPDGSSVTETMYPYDRAFAHSNAGFGGKEGLVYRVNQSNKVLIEKHWTLKNFGGENIAPGANVLVAFNPVVDAEYTSLLDDSSNHAVIKMSAKTYSYDYNGNLLSETDYDWFDPLLVTRDDQGVPLRVPNQAQDNCGSACPVALRTVTNEYHNDSTSASSGNVYARQSLSATSPLIQNALKRSYTGTAEVRLSYDSQNYDVAPTIGNLTSKSVYNNVEDNWITTSMTYDGYGNVATSVDGRGHSTTYAYDSSTQAQPVSVTVTPDGTNNQTAYTAYDPSTGLIISTTDVNNQVTTISYLNQRLQSLDPFGRPGLTSAPAVTINGNAHHQTVTTTYYDSARQVVAATDLFAQDDHLLKTRTTADMLGRPVLSEQTEDGTNYTIFSKKAYDSVNRIAYSSGPMRCTAQSTHDCSADPLQYVLSATTNSWTRVTNDILGRPTEVATFGGSAQPSASPANTISGWTGSVTTSFDANFTTVTDQAAKVRRSMTDGLGRLVRVDEPDSSGNLGSTSSPNQATSYDYDVLGNLLHVYQGSQTRTFTYDTLSRLRTAQNPESGTISYAYDANGNLTSKSDARSITTTYAYDWLNRVTSRSYSDGTETVSYAYDSLTNGIGRLSSVSSSVSSYSYAGYDAVGKVSGASQTIYGSTNQTYTMGYSYDLAGHVISMTYPSQHTVTNSYDNAGRLTGLAGTLGDNTSRTYSTGIIYSPVGGMTKEQFGTTTPIYNKLFYNSRGQLAEIREGTTYTGPTDTSWNRGAIINHYSNNYGCWGASCTAPDNNGNLMKQEVYIPGDDQISTYTMRWQQYDYDSLNRLSWVREVSGSTEMWRQTFTYDRYGNRTVAQGSNETYGDGIPKPYFQVDTTNNNNRLIVPSGYSGEMHYDAAGNLDKDTYSGLAQAYSRIYDAENRMRQENRTSTDVTARYSYDGDGRRVKRKVGNVETWQVYGIGGELIAEYAANASHTTPQKEYGYRNGQLLITATVPAGSGGTAPTFTDDPLNPNGTKTDIKLVHLTQLWTAINDLRTRAGLSAFSWTQDPSPEQYVTPVHHDHIMQIRQALEPALAALHLPTVPVGGYAHGERHTGDPIYAIDFQELRDEIKAAYACKIHWLVADQLGTPRMIFDQSGSLATTSRHDYLPFGEELFAETGGRTTSQGYSASDGVRQKFTLKERDNETGLDFFEARYFSSAQGRFASTDPLYFQLIMAFDPQAFNLYSYARNNPLKFVDPDGERVRLLGNEEWLRTNVLYAMVGGAEQFDQYFEITGGEVRVRSGVDLSHANAGVLELAGYVNLTKNLVYFAGTDGGEAASLFADSNQRGLAREFSDTVPGRRDSYGKVIGTQGRGTLYQPGLSFEDGTTAFAIIAFNTNTVLRQDGDGDGISRGVDARNGNQIVEIWEQQRGSGQRIDPVRLFIHESAENQAFARQQREGQAFDYGEAHKYAMHREAAIRRALRLPGGFGGGRISSRVPRRGER